MYRRAVILTSLASKMSEPSLAAVTVTSTHGAAKPYCLPFLQSPGRPPVPLLRWLAMFEDWLLAIGFPDTEAAAPRKATILRASLGTEGFRIYTSLATDPREAYAAAVARLESHFGQPASTIFNRAQFSCRQQRAGESMMQYIAALREMASKCDFAADQLDERVTISSSRGRAAIAFVTGCSRSQPTGSWTTS